MNDLKPLSCYVSLRDGGRSIRKAASIPFIVHDAINGLT